eukprot:508808_1
MDIDHHKLGIGPDYVNKKYANLLEAYNKQHHINTSNDDGIALLELNQDMLDHYGSIEATHTTTNGLVDPSADQEDEELKQDTLPLDELEMKTIPREKKLEKVDTLPTRHNQLRQQLLLRRERLLRGMTEQYGMTKEEVKKLLELTDNRAVARTRGVLCVLWQSAQGIGH